MSNEPLNYDFQCNPEAMRRRKWGKWCLLLIGILFTLFGGSSLLSLVLEVVANRGPTMKPVPLAQILAIGGPSTLFLVMGIGQILCGVFLNESRRKLAWYGAVFVGIQVLMMLAASCGLVSKMLRIATTLSDVVGLLVLLGILAGFVGLFRLLVRIGDGR